MATKLAIIGEDKVIPRHEKCLKSTFSKESTEGYSPPKKKPKNPINKNKN